MGRGDGNLESFSVAQTDASDIQVHPWDARSGGGAPEPASALALPGAATAAAEADPGAGGGGAAEIAGSCDLYGLLI